MEKTDEISTILLPLLATTTGSKHLLPVPWMPPGCSSVSPAVLGLRAGRWERRYLEQSSLWSRAGRYLEQWVLGGQGWAVSRALGAGRAQLGGQGWAVTRALAAGRGSNLEQAGRYLEQPRQAVVSGAGREGQSIWRRAALGGSGQWGLNAGGTEVMTGHPGSGLWMAQLWDIWQLGTAKKVWITVSKTYAFKDVNY